MSALLIIDHLKDCPMFEATCRKLVESIEEPDGIEELQSQSDYEAYGDTFVCSGTEYNEEEFFDLQKEQVIKELQKWTIIEFTEFNWLETFILDVLDDENCSYKEITNIAIDIIKGF